MRDSGIVALDAYTNGSYIRVIRPSLPPNKTCAHSISWVLGPSFRMLFQLATQTLISLGGKSNWASVDSAGVPLRFSAWKWLERRPWSARHGRTPS